MNKNVLYFTDDNLYIYSFKDKLIYKSVLPKNIVINGRIANVNKFIEKYESILKENKLNNGILGDKIKIIVHSKYTSADVTLLKSIFDKLNYRKVVIDNELKYYKLNDNNAWINVNDNYLLLTYINIYKKKETYLIEKDLFNSHNELFKFIKSKIGNKEVYLIGYGELYNKFYKDFERIYKNKTYTFANSENYIINCITNL